jgi:hypothetical protein
MRDIMPSAEDELVSAAIAKLGFTLNVGHKISDVRAWEILIFTVVSGCI